MSADLSLALPIAMLAPLAALAGLALGWLHFRSLELVAAMLLQGRMRAVPLQVGRMAALGGFLVLCALQGAGVLLAAALGVLAGRAVVLRAARQVGRQ